MHWLDLINKVKDNYNMVQNYDKVDRNFSIPCSTGSSVAEIIDIYGIYDFHMHATLKIHMG